MLENLSNEVLAILVLTAVLAIERLFGHLPSVKQRVRTLGKTPMHSTESPEKLTSS